MIERRLFGELSAHRYVEYAGLIRKSGAHLLGAGQRNLLDLSRIEAGRI
jgi:signal transduction histidine kinase